MLTRPRVLYLLRDILLHLSVFGQKPSRSLHVSWLLNTTLPCLNATQSHATIEELQAPLRNDPSVSASARQLFRTSPLQSSVSRAHLALSNNPPAASWTPSRYCLNRAALTVSTLTASEDRVRTARWTTRSHRGIMIRKNLIGT